MSRSPNNKTANWESNCSVPGLFDALCRLIHLNSARTQEVGIMIMPILKRRPGKCLRPTAGKYFNRAGRVKIMVKALKVA
jgi:hypothetical protein